MNNILLLLLGVLTTACQAICMSLGYYGFSSQPSNIAREIGSFSLAILLGLCVATFSLASINLNIGTSLSSYALMAFACGCGLLLVSIPKLIYHSVEGSGYPMSFLFRFMVYVAILVFLAKQVGPTEGLSMWTPVLLVIPLGFLFYVALLVASTEQPGRWLVFIGLPSTIAASMVYATFVAWQEATFLGDDFHWSSVNMWSTNPEHQGILLGIISFFLLSLILHSKCMQQTKSTTFYDSPPEN